MARLVEMPKPCTEDWAKMTPNERGRHCEKCQITLIDFTKMSDQEVIDFIAKDKGQSPCGTFRPDQVVPLKPARRSSWGKWAAVLVGIGALLGACKKQPQKVGMFFEPSSEEDPDSPKRGRYNPKSTEEPNKVGKWQVAPPDTTEHGEPLKGKYGPPPPEPEPKDSTQMDPRQGFYYLPSESKDARG